MGKIIGIAVGLIALVVLFELVLAWPFMWMWNYAVVGALTVAKPIGYWVAFWLMLFISLFVVGSKSSSSSSK